MLLVLDNDEQVVATVPLLVEMIVNCPQLKIIATSHAILRVHGEREYPVAPLALPILRHPADNEALPRYAGVGLFLERAQGSLPDFHIAPANERAVAEIGSRLEGLTLAIELAAKRVKVLSVDQIAARLNDACRLLIGGNRTAIPRQQTIQATMDWSYSLLSEQERTFFRRLCIFAGGKLDQDLGYVCLHSPFAEREVSKTFADCSKRGKARSTLLTGFPSSDQHFWHE
jgi:predicted ATPase